MNKQVMEDLRLLREYAEQRSERAFIELVNRHIDFVYSTALRVLNELSANSDVAVQPWVRIDGVLRIGKSVSSNQTVNLGI